MSSVWERFDGIASVDEVKDAKTQFEPIPAGEYVMYIEEIAPSESNQGLPMIKGKLRITENNRVVFYNQMLQNLSNPKMTAVNIAEAITFISGLLGEEIEYKGLGDFADQISRIPTGADRQFKISISYGTKDLEMKFAKLKFIEEVDCEFHPVNDEDIPF